MSFGASCFIIPHMNLGGLVFGPVLVGIGGIGLVVLLVAFTQRRMKTFRALLRDLASDRGFTYEEAGWLKSAKIQGLVDGREVIVDTFTRQAGNSSVTYSRIQLNSADLLQGVVLKAEGMGTNLWKMVAGSDETIGDEDFDDAVLVRGHEADVTATLDVNTRAVISEMTQRKIKLEKGKLYFERVGLFKNHGEINEVIKLMDRAARCMKVSGGPREDKLLANVLEDSDPEVRARNLAMLGLYHRHSSLIELALAAVLGKELAGQLSSADEEVLSQLLGGTSTGAPTAIDRQAAAAIALGRSGSAAAVPALREWAAGVEQELDFLKRLAHKAVVAIQQRIGPVDGGGLSIAPGSAGALSEAEGVGGELSVAEQEARRKKQAAAKKGRAN